jgi:hypothetical protein
MNTGFLCPRKAPVELDFTGYGCRRTILGASGLGPSGRMVAVDPLLPGVQRRPKNGETLK